MMGNVLVLVGSPKASRSTSDAIGTYLLDSLKEKGFNVTKANIYRSLASEKGIAALVAAVKEADIVILVFPLYADSLPSGMVKAMEIIKEDRQGGRIAKKQRLSAISNSGFPEAEHNSLALAICKRFALEAGFEWTGGLALGGGESVGGRPLEETGGMLKNVRKSLTLTADALARGEAIPAEAVELMAKPLMPRWLYLLTGNIGWRIRARQEKCKSRLDSRPYEE